MMRDLYRNDSVVNGHGLYKARRHKEDIATLWYMSLSSLEHSSPSVAHSHLGNSKYRILPEIITQRYSARLDSILEVHGVIV